jgi:hypothetical protein
VTPAEIAQEVRAALAASGPSPAAALLHEALDATSDGMPADYTARILDRALRSLGEA